MSEKPRTGRRSKATDPRIRAVILALRGGNTRRAAATFGGIDPATFYRWIGDDKPLPGPIAIGEKDGQPIYLELPRNATFRDAVEKAESDAEVRAVAAIRQAAEPQKEVTYEKDGSITERIKPGSWQAMAWWLERRRRDDWPRPATALTGKDGGPIETKDVTDGLDDHEKQLLAQLIREVAEAEGDDPADVAGAASGAAGEGRA